MLSESLNKDNFQYNKITGNNIQDFATIDWDIPNVADVEPPIGTITGINIGNQNNTILDGTINQNVVKTPTISLGDDDDIYGTRLCVYLHYYMRGEKKFDSLISLKLQISKDVDAAKEILAKNI